MKVPMEWLKEFVAIRLSPEELARRLTMAGSEVVDIERARPANGGVGGEPVLDLEITPNRPDCLSIMGIAREVAAVTGVKLKPPRVVKGSRLKVQGRPPRTLNHEPRTPLTIRIEDRQGCRRYIGRLIEGVRIRPSPAWMQKRLLACGIRPINNVVDITNYVLLECGQPLHAFDDRLLAEGTIIVRRARANENIVALDGNAYSLSSEDLVIADASRPVAVAGVIGGQQSAVNEHTTAVLLESANFDPLIVRRTARQLGVATESSYRFERGVDPLGVERASQRAAHLITELAGGREVAVVDVGERTTKPVVVSLDRARVDRWLGTSMTPATVQRTLQRLGCTVRAQSSRWRVQAPSFRRDLREDVDLIEEITRVAGYDRVPEAIPMAAIVPQLDDAPSSYHQAHALRQECVSLGLTEIITWSLVSESELRRAATDSRQSLRLSNPLSLDHAILRPTLLVGMLSAISRNLAQGAHGARLFEVGNVFEGSPAHETLRLGLGAFGVWERSWQGKQDADLFRLKGAVEQLIDRAARQSISVRPASAAWAEPGQSMEILLGDQQVGVLGQVARRACEAYDIEKPVWFGELDASALTGRPPVDVRVTAPSVFPPVKRDLSFLVERSAEYDKLLDLIQRTGAPLAHRVEPIDRYADRPSVPPTKHSLTFSIEYRDPSRTLTAAEVDAVHHKIGEELVRQFGAQLR